MTEVNPRGEVTRLLAEVRAGKTGAEDALMALVYEELCALARGYMRNERAGHTLQATALVHEAYLRLASGSETVWESRAHFLRVAARAMRRILIQQARRKKTDKRGGGWERARMEEAVARSEVHSPDLVALDGALERLESISERMEQVVVLRFFGGLSVEQTAEVLGTSSMTVKRDWRAARAWLLKELTCGPGEVSDPPEAPG